MCTNDPYRKGETQEPTVFKVLGTPTTRLDPTQAYYSHEGAIIDQIYEPPFTYHYLKRPYELIPQTAEEIPQPVYFDNDGNRIEEEDPPADQVARVEYTIRLRKDIRYQDHPCFAKDDAGNPLYRNLELKAIKAYESPNDFPVKGSRNVTAHDYSLQIRRIADPRNTCPIYSTMARYILGMEELNQQITNVLEVERSRRKEEQGSAYNQLQDEKDNPIQIDLMALEFPGCVVLDDYTYKIVLSRKYPQILYWMCMHFFGPAPQEVLDFYNQSAMIERQFNLMRWPIGSGPYYMDYYKPNEKIILSANPNFHESYYPDEKDEDDDPILLKDAGKRLPFITKQVWILEKEGMPAWNKFLQGYYDSSGIDSEVFDKVVVMSDSNDPNLSEEMQQQGIRLITSINTAFYYMKFNMLDDVVGGLDEKHCKLRQALSIAYDANEYLEIFYNGRGVSAQGPLPPGIFGYRKGEEGTNPYTSVWNSITEKHERKPLAEARKLLEEAGYPGGIDTQTGKQLTLYWDTASAGDTGFRAIVDWTRDRFAQLGVNLVQRDMDLSQFRKKQDEGTWQLGASGWLADYPDPENFLFLFYGPNGKVKHDGSNAANYENPEFDELFVKMESMQNGPERQAIIDQLMRIVQHDAPAIWQIYPIGYGLYHEWQTNNKPHHMSYNTIMCHRIDPELRYQRQQEWNKPNYMPLLILLAVIVIGTIPATVLIYRRERGL